jgi:hypothetical protein
MTSAWASIASTSVFWREGEDTKFKVLYGDPKAVERSSVIVRVRVETGETILLGGERGKIVIEEISDLLDS